jgi:outer membrane lipoprotein-sorting protein
MHTERTRCLAVLLTTLFFSGCAHVTREGIMQRASEKASSFEEINGKDSQRPEGYSELVIKAWIKIPQKEFYLIKKRPPRKESSEYPFVLNINGQGVLWTVNCTLDEQMMYVHDKRNPEGGEGLMCRLEKRMRLKSDSYKVYFGLPEEEFETEVVISLAEGSSNLLEFKPIYWRSGDNIRRFRHGISTFNIFFNDKPYVTSGIHRGGRWELEE